MRFSARKIASAVFAVFVLSAFNLSAQEPVVRASDGARMMESSTVAAVDPGGSLPGAPTGDTAASAATWTNFPRMEWFVGYSYVRAVPTMASGNRLVWLNGGSTSLAFNFNRHLGLVGDFGAYTNSQLDLTGGYTSKVNVDNPNIAAFSWLVGPRVSFRSQRRFTPFAQALFGGMRANEVTLKGCAANCTLLPSQNAFAMTAGGGLDVAIHHHIAIRVIQAEYLMTRFADSVSGAGGTQNDIRLSAGLVFRFGGRAHVQATTAPAPPAEVAKAAPEVEAPVVQKPLSLSCQADRSSVIAGDMVQVTATPEDESHDPLTWTWTETGGVIIGSGSSVRVDTSGLVTGRYVVTAHATGAEGGSADCSVNIDARTLTPLELKLALHSIYFPTAQPTVDDPSGGLVGSQKEILVTLAADFKTYLQTSPDARLLLEGHADPRASAEYNQALSQRRVDSARQFLIEQGIPAADIATKAFGEEQNLSDDQVRAEVASNPELTTEQRQKILDNLTTIILASNRRVDVLLTTTGQQSLKQYPFNAVDSLTLLRQDAPR